MRDERLARSGLISLTGSAVAAVSALVLTAIVGNTLGAGGTGLFFQAMGIFTILTQVLRLGTNSSIVRYIAGQRALGRVGAEWLVVVYAALPATVLAVLVSAAIWLLADPLGAWLADPAEAERLADLLRAMSPFIAMGALLGVLQISARMLRGVTAFTLLQSVLLPVSRLIAVAVAVSLLGAAAWGAFEAWLWPVPVWLIVTAAVIAGPFLRDLRRRPRQRADGAPDLRGFWRFTGPRSVSSALETALEWTDVLIVAALASPAAAGVYAVITRTVRAGGIVDKAMRVAVAPTISALLARDRLEESSRLHLRVVQAMILMNWPFYLLLIAMGPTVLRIFGEEFVVGAGPMILLAAAMMFQTACGMLQSILLQGGRSTWQMCNKAIALAASVAGNVLLVPVWGVWGAACTWLLVVVVDNVIAAVQVHRLMRVDLHPLGLLPAMALPVLVFGGGGAACALWAGARVNVLVVAVLALIVVYAGALWVLRSRLGIDVLWRRLPLLGRYA